jgi:hypothetical protein
MRKSLSRRHQEKGRWEYVPAAGPGSKWHWGLEIFSAPGLQNVLATAGALESKKLFHSRNRKAVATATRKMKIPSINRPRKRCVLSESLHQLHLSSSL